MQRDKQLLGDLLIRITLSNQAEHFQFARAQWIVVQGRRRHMFVFAQSTEQCRLAQAQFAQGLLQMAAFHQLQPGLQGRLGQCRLAHQIGHFADRQLQLRFKRQPPVTLRLIEQRLEPLQRLLRLMQIRLGQHQQVFDPRDQFHCGRRRVTGLRPTVVPQYAGQRFTSQWRATLLQPEVTADLQQHTAINRVGNLPLLHQAFGIAQPVKGLCVIALIGCHLCQPEKTIQRAFVLTVQAVLQTGLEELGSQAVLPLAERQSSASQGNSSQQRCRTISLPIQQFMDIRQQAFGTLGSAALLQPLGVIEFEQAFKEQRTLRPRQTQRLTVEGLRCIEVGAEQCLLGQPGQA